MNSKMLCRQCRDYHRHGKQFMGFCSEGCKTEFAIQFHQNQRQRRIDKIKDADKAHKKSKEKEFAAMKKEYKKNKKSTRERATREACHAYIRAVSDGFCISCEKPLQEGFHAGHFIESGNYPFIRYNEDNINGQCVSCNSYKGGNSGDYRVNLIKKIGAKRVQWLDDNKNKPIKRTAQDYKEIELYYKEKLKALN